MSDEQRLNSLERFRKQPGRLVLEEHSHCEVPAGCGGVVLRWRNPQAGLPVTIHLYTPVQARCLLDGTEVQTARVDLTPGRHVVACVIEDVNLSAGLIMFAAVHDPKKEQALPADVTGPPLTVVSDADGTWKYTLDRPATDEWAALSFDDRGWPALTKVPTPQEDGQGSGAYQCLRCAALGAACLGLSPPAEGRERTSWWQRLLGRTTSPDTPPTGSVWIRKVFEVPAPP
jgi:hypothetical protein